MIATGLPRPALPRSCGGCGSPTEEGRPGLRRPGERVLPTGKMHVAATASTHK